MSAARYTPGGTSDMLGGYGCNCLGCTVIRSERAKVFIRGPVGQHGPMPTPEQIGPQGPTMDESPQRPVGAGVTTITTQNAGGADGRT
jgi:hypothetical protein